MKTCKQCNIEYDDSKKFCKQCGNVLEDEQKLDAKTAARKNVLEEKLKADPLNVGLLHDYASFLVENGVHKTAVEVLLKLLAINENNTKASRLLFHTYLAHEDFISAKEIGEPLLADKPDDVEMLSGMAKVFYESGDFDKAITYSETALAVDASSMDALYCKALSKLRKKDIEEALPLFDALIKAGKTDDITNIYYGVKQSLVGNHESAVNLLSGVLSKDATSLDDQDVDRGLVHLCRSLLLSNASTSEIEEWFSMIDFNNFQNHIHELDEQSLADTIYGLLEKYLHEWEVIAKEVVNLFTSKFMIKPQVCFTGDAKNKLAAAWIMLAGKMVDQGLRKEAKDYLGHASGLLSANSKYKDKYAEVSKRLKYSIRRRNLKTGMVLGVVAAAIVIFIVGLTIKNRIDENLAWEVAAEEDTYYSYRSYIEHYSAGRYVSEARKLLEEQAWAEASAKGTLDSYQQYIDRLPNGRHIQMAREQLILVDERDGKQYKVVKIGIQWWMAENLNYATSRGSWCYGDNRANCDKYGRLYDWRTAVTACPPGWHLPSDHEWSRLIQYLGGEKVAGGKLKEAGTMHWKSPNTGATNSSGFSALPGGYRLPNGSFYHIGVYGFWWSSTETSSTTAWNRSLYYRNGNVDRKHGYKTRGVSLRCVRDNLYTEDD